MAIDRIEDEAMGKHPQAARVFIEPESLNEVYRQHRDRRLAFKAYEDEKRRKDHLGEFVAKRRQHNEERANELRERMRRRREEMARAYNRAYFSKLASGADAPADVLQKAGADRKKLFEEIPSIEGERIVLDRVVGADAEAMRDLVENPLVYRYEPTYLFEKQRSDAHETISRMYGGPFKGKESLILAIRMKGTGELAGLAEFYGLRESLHKVSIGYRLRERWWGKGLATEAARCMVGYLYGETDIEIITASTMVDNVASARVLEKANFIRTARGVEEDWGYPKPTLVDKWFC